MSASLNKRNKEKQRQERQREKESRRQERKQRRDNREPVDPTMDPDIAGIVPGPQPIETNETNED